LYTPAQTHKNRQTDRCENKLLEKSNGTGLQTTRLGLSQKERNQMRRQIG